MSGVSITHRAALAKGKSIGRQAVWEAIRGLGSYTLEELYRKARHVNPETAREYNSALLKAGFLTKEIMAQRGVAKLTRFTLCKDIGLVAPRVNKKGVVLGETGQQRMWRAMKMLKAFTLQELAAFASIEGHEVKLTSAQDYLKHLKAAQYVILQGDTYRLVQNTGGAAPMVQRTKVLFDPNLGRAICLEEFKD